MLLMCNMAVLIASALRTVANVKPFYWLCVYVDVPHFRMFSVPLLAC